MDSEFLKHRAESVIRALGILKAAIDRRLPPDEWIDGRLVDLEIEVKLLIRQIEKEQEQ